MTHPKAHTPRSAHTARAEPKRYRLTLLGLAWLEQRAPAGARVATCVHCGCTDERACPGGCTWIAVDHPRGLGICSQCYTTPRGDARRNEDLTTKNRRAFAQLRALNNALIAAGLHRPANSNAGEATSSTGRADQAAPRPLPPLHK